MICVIVTIVLMLLTALLAYSCGHRAGEKYAAGHYDNVIKWSEGEFSYVLKQKNFTIREYERQLCRLKEENETLSAKLHTSQNKKKVTDKLGGVK